MTNETPVSHSSHEGRLWMAVLVTESIVIVIINAFTLIAFARNRQLRKRSTYLIINLTAADLLVGAVAGPLDIYIYLEADHGSGFNWQYISGSIAYNMFLMASLVNLCLLSLERLHATLYPFKHCLIEEWFYFKTIVCSWLLALLLPSTRVVFHLYKHLGNAYFWTSLISLTLLILTLPYVVVIIKIKSSPLPHPVGAVASGRKLSVTLLIVTIASILTILPYAIYAVIPVDMLNELSSETQFHIKLSMYISYYACSIVNPLIYAIRMQEFRKAVYKQLICRASGNSNVVQPIVLHIM